MIEGSTHPFPDEVEQGVDLRCDNGHEQRFYLRGMSATEAAGYAAILDGTSPMYVRDPRSDPTNTWIGRCKDCGGLFTATPFGYEDGA